MVLLVLNFQVTAQTKIQLFLKSDKQIEKIDASDFSFKEIYNSEYKDTLSFSFANSGIDLYNFGCYINDKKIWTQVWLDTGNIDIHAHVESSKLVIDTVTNSPVYYYVRNFNKEFSGYLKTKDTAQINNFLLSKVQNNLVNPFSLWIGMLYLNINQNDKNKIQDLKETYSGQEEKFSWFGLYPIVIERMNKILSADNLNVLDFKFIDNQNKVTSLVLKNADFYVLDFWFLACAPCRKEHKIIKANFQKLAQSKIGVIGISTDRYSKEWKNYLSNNHYTWPNYLQSTVKKITSGLSINAFPYYIVVNKFGEIIGSYNTISDVFRKFEIHDAILPARHIEK
ncbi:MAG: TlpA disulfide reductase family protein [Ferruginibacter sp.]